jgi:hypothetical protein
MAVHESPRKPTRMQVWPQARRRETSSAVRLAIPGLLAQDTGRCRTRDDEGGSVTLTSTSEDRRESDPAR